MAKPIATEYDLDKKNKMAASLILISCSGDRRRKISAEKVLDPTFLLSGIFSIAIVLKT